MTKVQINGIIVYIRSPQRYYRGKAVTSHSVGPERGRYDTVRCLPSREKLVQSLRIECDRLRPSRRPRRSRPKPRYPRQVNGCCLTGGSSHHTQENEMPLKLEVGKTYVDRKGAKVLILAIDRIPRPRTHDGPIIGLREESKGQAVYNYDLDGASVGTYSPRIDQEYSLDKEYVPPVTHKVDVVWYKTRDGEIDSVTKPVGVKLVTSSFEEVHRQTVEYTE